MATMDWFAAEAVVAPAPARRRPAPRAVPKPRARPRSRARVRGGVLFITLFAILLTGVVAMNVAVLRAHIAVNKLNEQQLQLQQENSSLAAQLSTAGASLRIEQIAYRFGLRPALANDTTYINLGTNK